MIVGSRQKLVTESYDEISGKNVRLLKSCFQKIFDVAFFETFDSRILKIINARQGSWFHPKSLPERFLDA